MILNEANDREKKSKKYFFFQTKCIMSERRLNGTEKLMQATVGAFTLTPGEVTISF